MKKLFYIIPFLLIVTTIVFLIYVTKGKKSSDLQIDSGGVVLDIPPNNLMPLATGNYWVYDEYFSEDAPKYTQKLAVQDVVEFEGRKIFVMESQSNFGGTTNTFYYLLEFKDGTDLYQSGTFLQ